MSYRKDFEVSDSLYQYLMNTLSSMEAYCDSDRYEKLMRLLLGRMKIAIFHTENAISKQDVLRDINTQGCPGRLWTRHPYRPDCQASLERIIKTISNASVSAYGLCPSNNITWTGNEMHWLWAKKCINEYNFALYGANRDLFEITNRIKRSLDPELKFNYDDVLGKINDIKAVHEVAERVGLLFSSYAQHQINKLDVANVFIKLFTEDYKVYDRIFWILNKYAFSYLTAKVDTMEENTQRLFSDAFRVLETVMPYCNDDDTEQRIRNLSLWRHPLARLDVQDILSFKYTSDESWESWSLTLSFKEMVDTKLGERLLKDIVTSYSSVLRGKFLEIKTEFMRSVSQINSAIGLLVDDLKSFQQDNAINSDFILWVFPLMTQLIQNICNPL